MTLPIHGKKVISSVNVLAEQQGIYPGMTWADAKAFLPSLKNVDDKPEPSGKLLRSLAEWCITYAPIVAIDPPDGIIIEATGCAHLWGGEEAYLITMHKRLEQLGYDVNLSMSDTVGAAWALCHFKGPLKIIQPGEQKKALHSLPPAALRIDENISQLLQKLGIRDISGLIDLPRTSLTKRFGKQLLYRLDQALGTEEEYLDPVQIPADYQQRLPSLEPIVTATGIRIALEKLLERLCNRLTVENKGLRRAVFKCFRIDGKVEHIEIGTTRSSHNQKHIFKLFELKLESIEPALGIELFMLEAYGLEAAIPAQEGLWKSICAINDPRLSELLDKITNKIGADHIHRYLPAEHHWPERSYQSDPSFHGACKLPWPNPVRRPIQLLTKPSPIEVTAPIPDYPPMNFRYKNKLHTIKKADGPERIEQEWWIQEGEHRDYYAVEDQEGNRYWLFRSGHYTGDRRNQWFIHGFFT